MFRCSHVCSLWTGTDLPVISETPPLLLLMFTHFYTFPQFFSYTSGSVSGLRLSWDQFRPSTIFSVSRHTFHFLLSSISITLFPFGVVCPRYWYFNFFIKRGFIDRLVFTKTRPFSVLVKEQIV